MGQGTGQKPRYRSANVVVERSREWWRSVYTICLTEVTRSIREKDDMDLEHVLRILPVISEAAQSPELEELEANLRNIVDRQVTPTELADARLALVCESVMPEGVGA